MGARRPAPSPAGSTPSAHRLPCASGRRARTPRGPTLARPIARPLFAIPSVHKKLVDGRIADELMLQTLRSGPDDLLAEAELLRRSSSTA